MKEAKKEYEYPNVELVENKWCIHIKKIGSESESWQSFSTKQDAEQALSFARQCQDMGIALLVTRKIMIKK